jgi:hypothetical protein
VDILRISRDVYGRETLQGMSWDLIPVFFWLACALIAGHALYRALLAPKQR